MQLKDEGCKVADVKVIHSQGQSKAFGRHAVPPEHWKGCDVGSRGSSGKFRIAEGWSLWRHLKHTHTGIPLEVHSDDQRLDMYIQSSAWRLQTSGVPYFDTLRMCRAFRYLPQEQKMIVLKYGLKMSGAKTVDLEMAPVMYCIWHLNAAGVSQCPHFGWNNGSLKSFFTKKKKRDSNNVSLRAACLVP